MGVPVKVDELQWFLEEKLGRDVSLARFSHVADKNVFRMVDAQGLTFVKVKARAYNRCTADFLSVADLPFLPKVRFLFDYGERSVLGLDWQKGQIVRPEAMSVAQCADLTRAYNRLLADLRKVKAFNGPSGIVALTLLPSHPTNHSIQSIGYWPSEKVVSNMTKSNRKKMGTPKYLCERTPSMRWVVL